MPFQPRDFSFKGQVPQEAIMQAYQNKAKQEYQMKMQAEQAKRQKTQETLGIIQQASGLVQQGVQMSNQRIQKQARDAYAEMLGDPTATREQKMEKGAKAFPDFAAKESLKSLYADPLDRKLKQAQLDKTKRPDKAGTLDSPAKIKAHAIMKKSRGEEITPVMEQLIASDLQDPMFSASLRVYHSNPINTMKNPEDQVKDINKIQESINLFKNNSDVVLIQPSDGQPPVSIKRKDLIKARKIDPKLRILGKR